MVLVFIGRGGGHPANNVFAIGCMVAIAICVIYLFVKDRSSKDWENGEIPKSFKPTQQNLMEIYISAACAVIARDTERLYHKFGMVNTYLLANFRNEYYNFSESYKFSLKHIVKIDSLAAWCNTNLNESQKAQLLNFLVELSVNDGYFTDDEKMYIHVLTEKLHLNFDHIKEEFKKHYYDEEKKTEPRTYSSKQRFFKVLGLPETATPEEIKVAYRRLAKLTHPDRFMNETPQVQENMKRKFQEIQEAYEQISGN